MSGVQKAARRRKRLNNRKKKEMAGTMPSKPWSVGTKVYYLGEPGIITRSWFDPALRMPCFYVAFLTGIVLNISKASLRLKPPLPSR